MPISDSPGSFSFTSNDQNIASISGGNLNIIGAGTTTITALQNASGNYLSGTANAVITISKKVPSLTWSNFTMPFLSLSAASSASPFPLILDFSPVSDSPGTYYLVSGDPAMFSVNPTTGAVSALQNINASTTPSVTLTIGQNATTNYTATSVTATISITNPNLCSPTNPCQYGGSCSVGFSGQTYSGFTCSCSNNMTGKTCNTAVDQCASAPCQNGGTCTRTSTLGGPLNSYSCICPAGYGGVNCQTVLTTPTINFTIATTTSNASPFTLNPTSNSSGTFSFVSSNSSVATVSGNTVTVQGTGQTTITATQAPAGSYSTGTKSALLSVGEDVCGNTHPCDNGGTCTNIYMNNYSCSCPSGYSGTNCELSTVSCDGTNGNICYNGGTCHADVSGGYCTCVYPFIGTYCTIIDNSQASLPRSFFNIAFTSA